MKTHYYVNYLFSIFYSKTKTKIVITFLTFVYSESAYHDYTMTIFKNTFLCILYICCFLLVNNNKNWEYVVENIIFRIVLHDYPLIIFETRFRCKLFILCFFRRKQKQKLRICCWQYHCWNRLTGLTYDNSSNHVSTKTICLFTCIRK